MQHVLYHNHSYLRWNKTVVYIRGNQLHLREANRCLPVHLLILFLAARQEMVGRKGGAGSSQTQTHITHMNTTAQHISSSKS